MFEENSIWLIHFAFILPPTSLLLFSMCILLKIIKVYKASGVIFLVVLASLYLSTSRDDIAMFYREPRNVVSYELLLLIHIHMGC